MIDLKDECQDVRSDEIGNDEHEKRLPDWDEETWEYDSISDEEDLADNEHTHVPCVERIDLDVTIHLGEEDNDDVVDPVLDSE